MWICDDETNIKLGALQCAIEFGSYKPDKHPQGFLWKILKNYVPEHLTESKKTESSVLKEWKLLTENSDCTQKDQ